MTSAVMTQASGAPPNTQGMLDAVHHARIIQDMEHVLSVANIKSWFLQNSMTGICSDKEVEWVRGFHANKEQFSGLLLSGIADGESHCMAIVGALVRNFVDARVVPLNTLLSLAENGAAPDPTVLVVPNFYQQSFGKTLPAWKVSALYDLLLARYTAGKPTVLNVEDMKSMEVGYGHALAEHVKNHYLVCE